MTVEMKPSLVRPRPWNSQLPRMMRAVGLVLQLLTPRSHAAEPLVLEKTIPLHAVRGRIDHWHSTRGASASWLPSSAMTAWISSMSPRTFRCTA